MRGVVVDISRNKAIVLNDEGNYEKIKNFCYQPGQEVEYNLKKLDVVQFKKYFPIVAAAVILLFGVVGYANFTPYSYVEIDINPSVEIVSNIFDRVISVKPLNEDAKSLVSQISVNSKSIEEAVTETVNKAADMGFIKENISDDLMLTVTGKTQEKVKEIEKMAENAVVNSRKAGNVLAGLYIQGVETEVREEAQKENIPIGKLILIKRLKEVEPTTDLEAFKNKTVSGIIDEIDRAKTDEMGENKSRFEPLKNTLSDRVKEKKEEEEIRQRVEQRRDTMPAKPQFDNSNKNVAPKKSERPAIYNNGEKEEKKFRRFDDKNAYEFRNSAKNIDKNPNENTVKND